MVIGEILLGNLCRLISNSFVHIVCGLASLIYILVIRLIWRDDNLVLQIKIKQAVLNEKSPPGQRKVKVEKGRFVESLPRSSSDGRKRKIRVRVYQDRQVIKKGRSGKSRSRELSIALEQRTGGKVRWKC